jgi:hypothetical protein
MKLLETSYLVDYERGRDVALTSRRDTDGPERISPLFILFSNKPIFRNY